MSEIKKDKVLLTYVSDKSELLLDGYDLKKTANMYHFSASYFFDILPDVLHKYKKSSWEIVETKNTKSINVQTRHCVKECKLITSEDNYEELKRVIFEFAYLGCSDMADSHFYQWTANGYSLSTVLNISKRLIENRKFHAIYPTALGGYKIRESSCSAIDNQVDKAYQLLKK